MAANPMISPTRAKAMLDNLTGNFNSLYINIFGWSQRTPT